MPAVEARRERGTCPRRATRAAPGGRASARCSGRRSTARSGCRSSGDALGREDPRALGRHRREVRRQLAPAERVERLHHRCREVVHEVAGRGAERGQRARVAGDDRARDVHLARQRGGVQRAGAAVGHHRELGGVQRRLAEDHAHRVGHVGVDEAPDPARGLDARHPEPAADGLHERALGGVHVEAHAAAGQILEVAEHGVGVADGRQRAALRRNRRARGPSRRSAGRRAGRRPRRSRRSSRRRRRCCGCRASAPGRRSPRPRSPCSGAALPRRSARRRSSSRPCRPRARSRCPSRSRCARTPRRPRPARTRAAPPGAARPGGSTRARRWTA